MVLPVLDFSTVKNDVFPSIASTFSRTNSLAIKVRCLEAFTVLCGGSVEQQDAVGDDLTGVVEKSKPQPPKTSILDKYTIQEKLVPSLKAIKTKEPAVMMAALGVFRHIGKVADSDFLALEILPVLWSFSLGPLLDLRQFGEFMALIKSISSKIEREQMKKLQELSSAESTGFHNGTSAATKGSSSFASSETESARDNFERLVLGRSGAAPNGQENDMLGGLATDAPSSQSSTPRPNSTTFSWSSTTGSVGRQPSLAARSITPDFKVNSFPSLQPAPKQTYPALQPSAPNPWSTPTTPSHLQQSMTSGSGPSLSSLTSMNPTVSSSRNMQAGPNYSAFSIPPPPATQAVNAFANTSQTPFAPNAGQPSSFFANGAGQPQQAPQKQGLDKYQSLI
jgi:SCY1-like protein 2